MTQLSGRLVVIAGLVLGAAGLVPACAGGSSETGTVGSIGQPSDRGPVTARAPADAFAAPDGPPPTVATDTIISDLDQPTGAAAIPGTQLLAVAQRADGIVVVDLDHPDDRAGLIDLSADVGDDLATEQGVLGVAISPSADSLVVALTVAPSGALEIRSYPLIVGGTARRHPAELDVGEPDRLIRIDEPHSNHNGGGVKFGPDGALWIGVGDGGGSGDPNDRAQDANDLLGSLLRLNPDGSIPADNPFAIDAALGRPEIWAIGLRNPWRFSFDAPTGDLWIADVGQSAIEEISVLPGDEGRVPGANLGWSMYEGNHIYDEDRVRPDVATVAPLVEFDHDDGSCAVIGGAVYRGGAIPGLVGRYVVGDYCRAELRAITVPHGPLEQPQQADSSAVADLGAGVERLSSIATDEAGELLLLSFEDGTISRLVAG